MKWLYNGIYAVIFWTILCIIGFLTFDKLVMPWVAGRYKERIETPVVEGLSAEEAEKTLKEKGLNFYWMPEAKFSSSVPKGYVLSQIPVAGRKVKEARTVVLTVSKGLRELKVPSFRGQSQRQAEIALQQMGLVKDSLLRSRHATIPVGVVIRTEPSEGEWVKVGTKVNLVISSGVGSGTFLPNFIGRSFESAKSIIDSLGFEIEKEVYSGEMKTEVLPETILDQEPLGGEYLDDGTIVILKVSE